jgi:hypothetical protein
LKEPKLALPWLRVAAVEGYPCYPFFERDPNLNNLHNDPRFIEFMTDLKKQWEHYKSTL